MYLISAVGNSRLLYDVNSWELKYSYSLYNGCIKDISWSDDGKYIVQVDPMGVVSILCPSEQQGSIDVAAEILPCTRSYSAVFHTGDHKQIAIGTTDGEVYFWDTINKRKSSPCPEQLNQSSVEFISYNNNNELLAATKVNGVTTIYSLFDNNLVLNFELPSARGISAMKFCPESRCVIGLGCDEGHIFLRNVELNEDEVIFQNVHAATVSGFAFLQRNTDIMVSSGYDKVMNMYDTRLPCVVSTKCTGNILTSIATSSDYEVALGTLNGLIEVYDMRDMDAPLKVLKGPERKVSRLSFQPVNNNDLSPTEIEDSTEESITSTPEKSTQDNLKKQMFNEDNTANSDVNVGINSSFDMSNNMRSDLEPRDDLKDFMKEIISEIIDNDKYYFLALLMEVIKTNLFLKKQLSDISEQMQDLLQSQNVLDESFATLALKLYYLPSEYNILKEKISDKCNNVDVAATPSTSNNSNEQISDDGNNISLNVAANPKVKECLDEFEIPTTGNNLKEQISDESYNRSLDVAANPKVKECLDEFDVPSSSNNLKEPISNKSNNKIMGFDFNKDDDLKEFIKLSLSEVAYEEKCNYFQLVLEFTKRNLFLKKQLNIISEKIQGLLRSQHESVKQQQKIALVINKLTKAQ